MDGLFDLCDKLKKYAAYPVIFVSAALIAVYALSFFNLAEFEELSGGVKAFAPAAFGTVFCAFLINYSCRSVKKALAAAVCLMVSDAILLSCTGAHISFLFFVMLTMLFLLVMDNCVMLYGFFICLAAGVLISATFVLMNDTCAGIIKAFAGTIEGRGALFGALSSPFNLLFGSGFDDLFYTKAYSSTAVYNGKIVTGAVDIFNAFNTPQRSAAQYLCGKYFESIFIPLGVFASLYKRLEKETFFAFLFSLSLSVIFGDGRLFYLLLLLVSPIIYAGTLIITYIAYAVSSFVDIRIGFSDGAGVIELIRNIQKPVYFVLIAAIISALSFFLTGLVAEKFGVLSDYRLPRDVLRLVKSLGGEENILEISSGEVVVANPNLIDILKLDCDIRENRVSLLPDDFEVLRKLTK